MKNHKNLRKYLPATSQYHNDIMFNYLNKERHDELYLGQHLIISSDVGVDKNSFSVMHDKWKITYKGEVILKFSLMYTQGHDDQIKSTKQYILKSAADDNITFTTEKFHQFSRDDRLYMLKNFFYVFTCFAIIMRKIHDYVLRTLDLPLVDYFKLDMDSLIYKYSKDTIIIDERLKEVFQYVYDARMKKIPLLEKNEIKSSDQLKVNEK